MANETGKRDPLELARSQLDFAAIAAAAPASRDVLFKAQTMVPVAKTSPMGRTGKLMLGIAVALLLLLAPWLPVKSTLATARLTFDTQLTRPEAQEVINHYVRHLPPQVSLNRSFTTAPSAGDLSPGQLALSLGSVELSARELEAVTTQVPDSGIPGTDNSSLISGEVSATRWLSPVDIVNRKLAQSANRREAESGYGYNPTPAITANADAVKKGIDDQLQMLGARLEDFALLDPDNHSQFALYDFVISAEHTAFAVSVENYDLFSTGEQVALRERVADFLLDSGLVTGSLLLADGPREWLPLVVEVYTDDSSEADAELTRQLQAWLDQPGAVELGSPLFDPTVRVEETVERVIPGYNWAIDYAPVSNLQAGYRLFRIRVTLLGPRETDDPLYNFDAINLPGGNGQGITREY
jgi:hypothetical protein